MDGRGAKNPCRFRARAEFSTTVRLLGIGDQNVSYEARFLEHMGVIDEVIDYVCRRHRMYGTDAEGFAADVKLRLVERDYELLRCFEGRSSLKTYLTVVINRMYLDYRTRLLGKWRPSVEARRLGPLAVLLERLMERDGRTFEQAVTILQTNHRVVVIRHNLPELRSRFPHQAVRLQLLPEENANDTSQSAAD